MWDLTDPRCQPDCIGSNWWWAGCKAIKGDALAQHSVKGVVELVNHSGWGWREGVDTICSKNFMTTDLRAYRSVVIEAVYSSLFGDWNNGGGRHTGGNRVRKGLNSLVSIPAS